MILGAVMSVEMGMHSKGASRRKVEKVMSLKSCELANAKKKKKNPNQIGKCFSKAFPRFGNFSMVCISLGKGFSNSCAMLAEGVERSE